MIEKKEVKVGVGVYLFDEKNRLLLGLRKSPHGQGTWCPPGGHLEYSESFEQAALRETMEETGLTLKESDLSTCGVTNDFFKESGKHYITIHLRAQKFEGIAQVLEPEKCAEWRWFELNQLPENLFLPAAQFLKKNNFMESTRL